MRVGGYLMHVHLFVRGSCVAVRGSSQFVPSSFTSSPHEVCKPFAIVAEDAFAFAFPGGTLNAIRIAIGILGVRWVPPKVRGGKHEEIIQPSLQRPCRLVHAAVGKVDNSGDYRYHNLYVFLSHYCSAV